MIALSAQVAREFEYADRLGLEECTRGLNRLASSVDSAEEIFGFHVTGDTNSKRIRNAKQWEATKRDATKLERRRAQKRDCARRRFAREKGIAAVVMSDGSTWNNPDVVK